MAAPVVASFGSASSRPDRLLTVGGEETVDACESIVKVVAGDRPGAVTVRAAPIHRARAVDRLAVGAQAWRCDGTSDDRWIGVVYRHHGGAAKDCGVAVLIPKPRRYYGPCRSGWIVSRRLKTIAG